MFLSKEIYGDVDWTLGSSGYYLGQATEWSPFITQMIEIGSRNKKKSWAWWHAFQVCGRHR
jgi:hypothetical protein